jgi:lysophospholipase L1-like esterase
MNAKFLSVFATVFLAVLITVRSAGPDPALAPITDTPGLPRVLIIGDSVSIGYTPPVRALLQGKANVHRIPQNGSSSGTGVQNLQRWLGDGKWDVIHFNFGLHDAKQLPEGTRHADPETYEKNLREIVKQLRTTGAKLIWATTTPVPDGGKLSPTRRFDDIAIYNGVAKKVMEENGVAIDDLNAAILPKTASLQTPHDVHFTKEGSQFLGELVAASITAALAQK